MGQIPIIPLTSSLEVSTNINKESFSPYRTGIFYWNLGEKKLKTDFKYHMFLFVGFFSDDIFVFIYIYIIIYIYTYLDHPRPSLNTPKKL